MSRLTLTVNGADVTRDIEDRTSLADFLRTALQHLRAQNIDIVPLDEVHRRMTARDFARRFASFTYDDGYRDNRDHALPVMREFDAPLTVYVASDFAQGTGRLWWVALERAIAATRSLEMTIDGERVRQRTGRRGKSIRERQRTFGRALETRDRRERRLLREPCRDRQINIRLTIDAVAAAHEQRRRRERPPRHTDPRLDAAPVRIDERRSVPSP